MKKIITLLITAFLLCGCHITAPTPFSDNLGDRLKVSASIFPQYDFVKQIAKDRVEVSMVLPAGAESHTFEPAPTDIIKINSADLFIYTGEAMEPWAKRIISGVPKDSDMKVMDLSEKIPYKEGHEDHDHDVDPHFFTNPVFAIIAVKEISAVLCELDPKNASFFQKNTDLYVSWLLEIDQEIRSMVEKGTRDEIVFGGRFAFRYFAEEYGIKCITAFEGCTAESDPGLAKIYEIIIAIQEKGITNVYHEELSDPKIARFIAEETGAKLLLLHSCHNITRDELNIGVGYLDLMKKNLVNLERGLNRWD